MLSFGTSLGRKKERSERVFPYDTQESEISAGFTDLVTEGRVVSSPTKSTIKLE